RAIPECLHLHGSRRLADAGPPRRRRPRRAATGARNGFAERRGVDRHRHGACTRRPAGFGDRRLPTGRCHRLDDPVSRQYQQRVRRRARRSGEVCPGRLGLPPHDHGLRPLQSVARIPFARLPRAVARPAGRSDDELSTRGGADAPTAERAQRRTKSPPHRQRRARGGPYWRGERRARSCDAADRSQRLRAGDARHRRVPECAARPHARRRRYRSVGACARPCGQCGRSGVDRIHRRGGRPRSQSSRQRGRQRRTRGELPLAAAAHHGSRRSVRRTRPTRLGTRRAARAEWAASLRQRRRGRLAPLAAAARRRVARGARYRWRNTGVSAASRPVARRFAGDAGPRVGAAAARVDRRGAPAALTVGIFLEASTVRLRTFGGLWIEDLPADAAPRPRALALLAILAAAGAKGASRDRILGGLWPDAETERARHALSQTIYSLRKDLGLVLVMATPDLRLDVSLIASDVAELDAAVRAKEWREAAALYTGPFLEGFYLADAPEFERWVETERSSLAANALRAFEQLARESATNGRDEETAEVYRRLVRLDPVNSRYAIAYMEAHDRLGDRTGALAHGKAYADHL